MNGTDRFCGVRSLTALAALLVCVIPSSGRAEDLVVQKREQYRRILVPPQERGFNRDRWLELCAAPTTGLAEFGRLEDLFDLRSQVYALAMRTEGPEASAAVERGYRALSDLDADGARKAIAELAEIETNRPARVALTAFSPFNWIKCFAQWGYARHPDGCSVYEPMPWNLTWQDGFRCAVAQDKRVVVANSKGHPAFYETRFLEPMTDVSFTRDWVSTKWHMPNGSTVTFSVLTPVVDIANADTVTLSGFPTPPERVVYNGIRAEPWYIQLSDAPKIEAEVVHSALMDYSTRPEIPPARSWGVQKIDPKTVGRPWLKLYSTAGNWSLYLLLTERPVSVCWQKGVFTLKLEKKGAVGLLRPPANLQDAEQPAVIEFFVRTALPDGCREYADGNRVGWRYTYRKRSSAWGIPQAEIAPVPPLADYTGVQFKDSRTVKYPTRWNLFRYVDGDRCAAHLPDCPREPVGRIGVNASVWSSPDELASLATNGLRWVRLFASNDRDLAATCGQYDRILGECGKMGVKVLVDPHNPKEYHAQWKGGISPDDDAAFVAQWDELSKVGAKHNDVVIGYDLYNEPGLVAGSEERWRSLCGKAADVIRRNHPSAKIYYPGIYGGNPNGLYNLRPLDIADDKQVVTYHFYSPHSFTHQKVKTRNRGNDTCIFYPSWAPAMDWGKNHFSGTTVDWFDKWTLGALLLPTFEHYAEHRMPLNCGEFAVIGYASAKTPGGAYWWTRDTVEILTSGGHGWNIWNLGFGLCDPRVRKYIYNQWKEALR